MLGPQAGAVQAIRYEDGEYETVAGTRFREILDAISIKARVTVSD
jgi:hypothetical protein